MNIIYFDLNNVNNKAINKYIYDCINCIDIASYFCKLLSNYNPLLSDCIQINQDLIERDNNWLNKQNVIINIDDDIKEKLKVITSIVFNWKINLGFQRYIQPELILIASKIVQSSETNLISYVADYHYGIIIQNISFQLFNYDLK